MATYITMAVKHVCVTVMEHLRYAKIIEVQGGGHTGSPPMAVVLLFPSYLRKQPGWYLITMECPASRREGVWVRQNMARLASFNVLAVSWRQWQNGRVLVLGTSGLNPLASSLGKRPKALSQQEASVP